MQQTVLGIIPARGGSKGIKDKNIIPLNGKPLIAWTIDAAKKSGCIDRLIVSTDSEKISDIALEYGAEVMMRPPELAQDSTPTVDAVFHCLNEIKLSGYVPDYVMLLQCTTPLRKAEHIRESLELLLSHPEIDSLISVTPLEHPIQWVRSIDKDGFIKNYFEYDMKTGHQRQNFTQPFRLNGAIYLAKTDVLHEFRHFQTARTIPYIMGNLHSVDIDTMEDLNIASAIMKMLETGGNS